MKNYAYLKPKRHWILIQNYKQKLKQLDLILLSARRNPSLKTEHH